MDLTKGVNSLKIGPRILFFLANFCTSSRLSCTRCCSLLGIITFKDYLYFYSLSAKLSWRKVRSLVEFNGANYTSWAFHFQIYPKGKELSGHVDGSDTKPIDDTNDSKAVIKWETKDTQIITWILGTVDLKYILNFRPYKTA